MPSTCGGPAALVPDYECRRLPGGWRKQDSCWLQSPAPDRTPVCLQIVHECANASPPSLLCLEGSNNQMLCVQDYEQVTQQQAAYCCPRPPYAFKPDQTSQADIKLVSTQWCAAQMLGPHNRRCWALITPDKKEGWRGESGRAVALQRSTSNKVSQQRLVAFPKSLHSKSLPIWGSMMLDSACAGAAPARTTCNGNSSNAFLLTQITRP